MYSKPVVYFYFYIHDEGFHFTAPHNWDFEKKKHFFVE